jgi:hypothetical protein
MDMTANEMAHVSMTMDEIQRIKQAVCNGRPYANRISFPFCRRLIGCKARRGEDINVLREVDSLEGLASTSVTKDATQFRRQSPLYPFWHKHFYAPRHFFPNIAARWGLTRDGNRDLMKVINEIAARHGHAPEAWQKVLPHRLVMDGWRDRVSFGLTGDWIIFAKHGGVNFYLDLATHEEGDDAVMTKLRRGCATEFPFLFEEPTPCTV